MHASCKSFTTPDYWLTLQGALAYDLNSLMRKQRMQSMINRRSLVTAVCAVTLVLPAVLMGQQDTTRMRDSTRMRDTTMRTGTGMPGTMRTMQDTTSRRNRGTTTPRATSERRLRVQKNTSGSGAVSPDMRADSIAAAERARADSVNMAMGRQRDSLAAVERMRADSMAALDKRRADSLAVIESARRESAARADSIAREAEARRQYMSRYRLGGTGWYVGLGAGVAVPTGNLKSLGYNSGYQVTVPVGWHRPSSFLGVRMDFNYTQFSGRQFLGLGDNGSRVTLDNANPDVLSATFNLTARLPLNVVRNVSLYGVAGGGLYHFRKYGRVSALSGYLGNDVLMSNESTDESTRNKFGAQLGGGLDWTVGTSAIYVESRLENVFADQDDNVQFRDFVGSSRSNTLRWVPIVIGVKIR